MKVECSHCGTKYNAPKELEGKEAKCRKCNNKFHVIFLAEDSPINKSSHKTVENRAMKADDLPEGVFALGKKVSETYYETVCFGVKDYKSFFSKKVSIIFVWDELAKLKLWQKTFEDESPYFEADVDDIFRCVLQSPQVKYLIYNSDSSDGDVDEKSFFIKRFPKERLLCLHSFNDLSVVLKRLWDEETYDDMKSIAKNNPKLTTHEIYKKSQAVMDVFSLNKITSTNSALLSKSGIKEFEPRLLSCSIEKPGGGNIVYDNSLFSKDFDETAGLSLIGICRKCSEQHWDFMSLSPNKVSAKWKCSFCGTEHTIAL